MIQVKIIKDYKMMKIGAPPRVDDLYAAIRIKKGVAKDAAEKAEKPEKK